MAKAETFGKPAISRDGTGTSFRDYTSLLGVVAAGILGMSLLCITSAIALSSPNQSTPFVLEPASIVDLAVNNINTVSALTVQALSTISIESTPILIPSETPTGSPTVTIPVISSSATRPAPTRTRPPRTTSTSTPRPPSTITHIPPTNTQVPPTNTPLPPPTNTFTPLPPDTNTPVPPPDTDTPIPPPDTNTPVPPPDTDTPPPADTPTP